MKVAREIRETPILFGEFFFEEVNGGVDPYKVAPPCRYDHRALVAYAEK